MTDFDLAGAHPDYRREIPEILAPLVERYPGAKLRSVRLYDPKPGDTSMGATYLGGEVRLNSYWFAREPSHLQRAALHHSVIEVGGIPMGWHSDMPEPRQVLTHEFFHVLSQSPEARELVKWAENAWRLATRRPKYAPTGYALASPDEFLAECCACSELDKCDFVLRSEVDGILQRLRSL